jgi:hypothetical protein
LIPRTGAEFFIVIENNKDNSLLLLRTGTESEKEWNISLFLRTGAEVSTGSEQESSNCLFLKEEQNSLVL